MNNRIKSCDYVIDGELMSSAWTSEQLFFDGDAYFQHMLEDLDSAKVSIRLESYIFQSDHLGNKIAEALKSAQRRGVRCELLVDGIGSIGLTKGFFSDLLNAGVAVQVYHPPPRLLEILRPSRFSRLNRRNHRKTCVVDERIAFVGGMNVDERHLKSRAKAEAWKDAGVRVEGENVKVISRAFELAFFSRTYGSKLMTRRERRTLNPLVLLNNSIYRRRHYRKFLIEKIHQAQHRVWLTTPYFVPPFSFVQALCSAGQRVDVRLLLTQKPDHFFMRWANQFYYLILLKNNVRIYEYTETFLHSKTTLIDDWGTVGSSNRNYRSFFHDLEVDVVLTSEKSIQGLSAEFEIDSKKSKMIEVSDWQKRPWLDRFAEKLLYFFRRWL